MATGTVFVNRLSGRGDTTADQVRDLFPGHAVVACAVDELADRITASVAGGTSFVGVAGGDGSIRCAASILADTGVPLLAVPVGTRNHFAGALGIELPADAAEAVRGGSTRHVDLGEVNGHCFVNTASIGFYAALVRERTRQERHLPRAAADVAAAWAQARHGHRFPVRVDEARYRAWLVFVGNGCYGDTLTSLGRRRALDEGTLDVRVLRADAPLARTRAITALVAGRLATSPLFVHYLRDRVDIDLLGRSSVDVALDGEVVRLDLPLSVRSRPGALEVLVP